MTEQRFYSRFKIEAEAIGVDEKGRKFHLEIKDISAEGARFKAYQSLDLYKGEMLSFLIKTSHKIKVKGEIKWIKKNHYETEFGVQFLNIDIETRQVLSKIILDLSVESLLKI